MAVSPLFDEVNVPIRSISLPSRLKPNGIEAELNELKTNFGLDAGSETICAGFTRLAELYNNIEETIQSQLLKAQQALHHQQNVKLVEEALDESVGLLDACGTARDLILMMKEQVQDLQSALRRRGGDSSIRSYILAYISFRKKFKKHIAKSLRVMKRLECKKHNSTTSPYIFDVDCQLLVVVKALREANTVTISMFSSLLSFLSTPVMKTKAGGWSLISRLIPVGGERRQKVINEVGFVDFSLHQLHGKVRKSDAKIDAQIEVRRLETLCASIKGLEAGLDCLFRCLIRNRVSLLNILTP